jgi:hypothetical protein
VLLECGGARPLWISRENLPLYLEFGAWDLGFAAAGVHLGFGFWDLELAAFGSVHGRK